MEKGSDTLSEIQVSVVSSFMMMLHFSTGCSKVLACDRENNYNSR